MGEKEAKYNLRVIHPAARFIRDVHGMDQLSRVSADAALTPEQMQSGTDWICADQLETILTEMRRLVDSDEAFKAACVYRHAESLGAIRYVLWATSPTNVYSMAIKTYHLVSTDCKPEIVRASRTSMSVRYANYAVRPSRLNCLARQASFASLPTLWGLPAGEVREEKCVSHGDDECLIHVRWFDVKRWLPIIVGMALGGLAAATLNATIMPQLTPHLFLLFLGVLIVLGGMVGYAYELNRTNKDNLRVGNEINDAVRKLAAEEAEARLELLAMAQRQRDWSRVVEEEGRERSRMVQSMVDRIQSVQRDRERTLRGFSHDLRNPLTIFSAGISSLRDVESALGDDGPQIIDDFESAVEQMTRLLNDLMAVATSQTGFVQLGTPESVPVHDLPERWRRRLRALTLGKDIRVSSFRTREAPESIEIDPIVLDRVIDNLLSNAAKYTERGSIIVEVDGTPGFLTVKISDTGRGIVAEKLSKTFEPGGSDVKTRAANSFGVGLSVVVQLLGQIGGKLDVMSKPSVGTTFWIHFPLVMKDQATPSERPRESYRETLNRVLTIRKVSTV